jgi:Tol biopolymer transport system component
VRVWLAAVALALAVAAAGATPALPAFPGRNGELLFFRVNNFVFDADAGISGLELWRMNADGKGQRRITDAESFTSVAEGGQWSPDGTRIAFTSDCGVKYEPECGRVYVVDASGRGRRLITNPIAPVHRVGLDVWPTWSPDGIRLAFTRLDPGPGVYVAHLRGGRLTRISSSALGRAYWDLAWSPDGRRIAFWQPRGSSGVGAVSVMRADGTGKRLLAFPTPDDADPDWSPDGTRIVFTRSPADITFGEGSYNEKKQVCIVAETGGHVRCLTRGAEPAWSPDASEIAFARGGDIYVMRADGTQVRNVTRTHQLQESAPDWQPLRGRR